MVITSYVEENAKTLGNEEAIIIVSPPKNNSLRIRESFTWAEFFELSNRIGNMLVQHKIKKGDKVAIVSENSLFWLPIYFGILSIGAIAVLINHNNTVEEINYCLDLSDTRFAFVSANILLASLDYNACNIDYYVIDKGFLAKMEAYPTSKCTVSIHGSDAAAIYFSSGTTGRPKAVLLSHSALVSGAHTEKDNHKQKQTDIFLCLTPLYHAGAKIHWFGSLIVGGSIVILNSSSPSNIAYVIKSEKITIAWFLVPQMRDILDYVKKGLISDENFKSLRLMHSGAQPIPKELIYRWLQVFPDIAYDISYGLTEAAGPGCINLGLNNFSKIGSIGTPSKGWAAKIISASGDDVGTNVAGELAVSGPGVMMEYYKDTLCTSNTLVNGWLLTGDLGYKDQEGYIYIVGRKKDIIISGGENIYPIQIENHLRKFPEIKDVAVFGYPSVRMGEVVAVVVELYPGCSCTKLDIVMMCKELPMYQQPAKIFWGTVTRNSNGKIDKRAIARAYIDK